MYATCSYCLQHSPQTYLQDSSSVHRYRVLFWGGKFSRPHKSNLTCIKPLISTDSHSMAAYIFLWWVLVRICFSQIWHFREIMQLPMLRNSRLIVLSHSVVCCRAYAYTFACKTQEETHEFLVTVIDIEQNNQISRALQPFLEYQKIARDVLFQ